MGYSLQANVKTVEGTQHPDRDAQFRYLNQHVRRFLRTRDPVVSVDTKKKELVGSFKNPGRRWTPKGAPDEVSVHDFPALGTGKAIPYGTYDVARDEAVVNVGITHDTAEFAVDSIRRWWRLLGRKAYPDARRLLICADAGGSNGSGRGRRTSKPCRNGWRCRSPSATIHPGPASGTRWNTGSFRSLA